MRVVIVGGGISGLSVAFLLRRAGCDVTVLEAAPEAGGTVGSVVEAGYLRERGPNSAADTGPAVGELIDALNLRGLRREAAPGARNRYLLRGGRLHALPTGPGTFLSTPLWSARAKLRLAREPFVGRGAGEETVAAFVTRRLGREFLDYAVEPFVAGVYAGDPGRLSVAAAFPRLYELEQRYGSLIRGALLGARARRRRPERARVTAGLFSFRDGMATFPRALAAALGGDLRTGVQVRSVHAYGGGFRVEFAGSAGTGEAYGDRLVLSVPAYEASRLLRDWLPGLAGHLAQIEYPPVAVAALGYRRAEVGHPLDGFGFLVPAVERRRILGTIWNSSLFPGRAPEGHVLLTSFLGGARQPDTASRPEEEILALAHAENAAVLDIAAPPAFARVQRWPRAIPQYRLGHLGICAAIAEAEAAVPGFHVCANYRGGVAFGDCLAAAKRTADTILGRAA